MDEHADSARTAAGPAADPTPVTELWVERTGGMRFTGRSSRGAEVLVGRDHMDGVFTPGELLKVALAACAAMSAEGPLVRRLGEDVSSTVRVSGVADREEERYPRLTETFELDLSGFEPEDRARIRDIVTRSIDRACTVGRTLEAGAEVVLEFADDADGAERPGAEA